MCSGPWPHFLFIQPVQLHKAAWLLPVLSSKFCEIKARKVLVAQLCPTPCEPMDSSPPGSSVHEILQERILEWVAVPFSRVSHQSKERSQKKNKNKKTCQLHLKVKVKVAQLCPALCDPMDYTVPGILQARTLEGVALPFSRGSSQPGNQTQVSLIPGGFLTSWATREALNWGLVNT